MDPRPLSMLSLCAGVEGLGLGVQLAVPGARTVCYVEREAYCCAVLAARMQDEALAPAPVWSDLGTFDGRPWRGRVDIVTAGLPCQPYSVAGKRRGHEDERAIWPTFVRIVEEVRPSMVFLENVPAFLQFFRPVGEALSGLGYWIEAGLFSAAEVGAPHRRERLFVLAGRVPSPLGLRVRDEPGRRDGASGLDAAGPAQASTERGGGMPLFPPGPGGDRSGVPAELQPAVGHPEKLCRETQQWGQQDGADDEARIQGASQPPLRRVADGASVSWVDQLRALGNGVVPLQAAHAFRTLAARMEVR